MTTQLKEAWKTFLAELVPTSGVYSETLAQAAGRLIDAMDADPELPGPDLLNPKPDRCALQPSDWWAIIYEDKDRTPEIFNSESAAREVFSQRSVAWTCGLFRKVPIHQPKTCPGGQDFDP